MKFIPEKAKAVNGIIIVIVISLIIMGAILSTTDNILTRSLMFILIGATVAVSIFFFSFLKTLYYEIDEDAVKIRSVFSFLDIVIPIQDILYYTEKITLLNQAGILGIISKRFSVGKGYIEGMGKVDMYITSSRKTIFIVTEVANYAVSPAEMDKFSKLLKSQGVEEEIKHRDVLPKDVLESRNRLNQYFLLGAVMLLIYVGVPMTLYYLDRLPDYISIALIGSNVLSFVSAMAYIDSVVGYAGMAFVLSIVFYVLTLIYAKIDKIYFYRLMIIPLVISFLLLLSLSNTLISIFL